MGKYRAMNWSPLEPDPVYPKPMDAPVILGNDCQELDGQEYLAWKYPWADADTITGYWVRVSKASDPTTIIVEKFVAEPDTDVIVDGLVNGTLYQARLSAQNRGGEGKPSAVYQFQPRQPVIPTPTLKTCTGGDGQAIATWSWAALPDGYTYDWISYEAVNEVGAVVTEHVTGGEWPNESGMIPLANDHDWKVALVAVARKTDTGKQYVSDLSNAITVHTEQPIAPYRPRLLGAQLTPSNNGQVELSFAPGIQDLATATRRRWWHRFTAKGRTGPGDITAWQIRGQSDGQPVLTYDILDGSARTYTTSKVALGTWVFDVRAKNAVGFSTYSNQLAVTYKPTDDRPFTADRPFALWSSATWNYAIFDPGNDPQKGWDVTWQLTLTTYGKTVPYGFCVISGGGGGKGQTATLGKGGNGGGGQVVYDEISPTSADSMTVFASIGGSTAIDPKGSVVTVGGKAIGSNAGRSASSGADATGYPRTQITQTWLDCWNAFGWLDPDSTYVGGTAIEGKQGYPNGLGWGCGGAGTKNGSPGRGVQGLVIIRWPK